MVLNHNLDFSNQAAALTSRGGIPLSRRTPSGLPANVWPAGPALLWLPFFLLAHGLAIVLNGMGAGIRLDGCGYWHQSFVIAGNIAHGGLGLALAFDAARRVVAPAGALWAALLLTCAATSCITSQGEPSMSHPVSLFAVAAFYACWMKTRGQWGAARAATLGALIGLIALVRTQEVLLAVVPLLGDFAAAWRRRETEGHTALSGWIRDMAVVAAVALAVYSPQFVVAHVLFGAWWQPPQLHAGWGNLPLFTWSSPHLLDALVSVHRGLFVWHPIYAVALVGVVPLWRKDRWLAAAVLGGVLSQAYVIGGRDAWGQGHAFGGRGFIGRVPLLALSLGALLEAAWRRASGAPRLVPRLTAAVAALLILVNLLLLVEYRLVLATTDREVTWRDLGIGRIEVLVNRREEPAAGR